MIKGNLRLVVKIAREFEGLGLPLLDLISEGNIGLMKAVERFDPRRGVKLSSYASLWIRQSLRRALVKQAKIVRLPVNFQERLFRIGYVVIKLRERLAREPTDGEIAEELGLSVVKVKRARQGPFTCVSLDELQHDGQGTPGYELIADENAWTAYETVAAAAGLEMLEEFMGQLSLRERTVLRLRFGLEGEEEQTLEEVSRQVGLTREGVRQIQNKALQKLRRQIEKRESIPFRTSKSAVWNETIRHGRA
jgi:RNA polymerase primary sigma factor